MTSRGAWLVAAAALTLAGVSLLLLFLLPRQGTLPGAGGEGATTPEAAEADARKTITARLFYVSDDGMRLTSVEREVPFGEGAEQAREIVLAQLEPPDAPLVSAVPPGTRLRALFVTDAGDAYVDLSREAAAHPGGTSNELLTVYTIVDALTVNLPAVQAVQILIDGREVQTLAGHVDLRQPLAKNLSLVQ